MKRVHSTAAVVSLTLLGIASCAKKDVPDESNRPAEPVKDQPAAKKVASVTNPRDDELAQVLADSPAERQAALAGAILKSEGTRLYGGQTVVRAGEAMAQVPYNMRSVVVLRALTTELASLGCADSVMAASAAVPQKAGALLSAGCPATGAVLSANQLRETALWAGCLAIVLEVRARAAQIEQTPLHRALVSTLLKQRRPPIR